MALANCLTSLHLSFLICEMDTFLVSTSQCCWEYLWINTHLKYFKRCLNCSSWRVLHKWSLLLPSCIWIAGVADSYLLSLLQSLLLESLHTAARVRHSISRLYHPPMDSHLTQSKSNGFMLAWTPLTLRPYFPLPCSLTLPLPPQPDMLFLWHSTTIDAFFPWSSLCLTVLAQIHSLAVHSTPCKFLFKYLICRKMG